MANVTFKVLAQKYLNQNTPVHIYNPATTELEEDGGYIMRMAPTVKPHGCVFIPDINTDEYYRQCLELPRTRDGIDQDKLFLREEGILQADQVLTPLLFAVFTILHEEGHWIHFQTEYHLKGRTGEEFNEESNQALVKLGVRELSYKCKDDISLFGELQRLYRSSPFEQAANNHAIRRLRDLLVAGTL